MEGPLKAGEKTLEPGWAEASFKKQESRRLFGHEEQYLDSIEDKSIRREGRLRVSTARSRERAFSVANHIPGSLRDPGLVIPPPPPVDSTISPLTRLGNSEAGMWCCNPIW